MRVSISHDTMTKGLIFKKTFYRVTLDCQFNQEELHIIKEGNLDKVVVQERKTPACARKHRSDGPEAYDALTIKPDHPIGASQMSRRSSLIRPQRRPVRFCAAAHSRQVQAL